MSSDTSREGRSKESNAAAKGTRQNVERYKQKRKQQTRIFQDKKRRLEDEMEQLYRSQETRKFYKKLKASRKGFMPQADMCRGVDGNLLTDEREVINFNEHLNVVRTEEQAEDNDYIGERNDEAVPVPTMNEVKETLKQLKNNKTVGIDGLAPNLFTFEPGKLIRIVHRVMVWIWEPEQLPDEWKDGVICPIYKKGNKLDCENYQAFTITNAAYKI